MKNLILCFLSVILFVSFIFILNIGIKKTEAVECELWQAQDEDYSNFYFTDWQKAQCNIN